MTSQDNTNTRQEEILSNKIKPIADAELAKRTNSSVIVYFILFVIIVASTPYFKDHTVFTSIIGVLVIGGVTSRIILARAFPTLYSSDPKLWTSLYFVGTYISGLVWGVLTCMTLYFYGLNWIAIIVVMMTCGIASGSTMSLTSRFSLARNYLACLLLPLIIWGFVEWTRNSLLISLVTTIYMVMLIVISKNSWKWYLENLKNSELLNNRTEELHALIRKISSHSETLSVSSAALSQLANQMLSSTVTMSEKAGNVAISAGDMNAKITHLSASMTNTTESFNAVASSIQEMTATIDEIAGNTNHAHGITEGAVAKTEAATGKVNRLGDAAQEIGKVSEVIAEISEQTNLLALNATIEAARAGDAGKGFAVVATEIKELARQTADATLQIKDRVTGIQQSTTETIDDIKEISDVVNSVNEVVTVITAAAEEQSVATREITGVLTGAADSITGISHNIAESSAVAEEIANNISVVNDTADEMTGNSTSVKKSAEVTLKLANQLMELTETIDIQKS